MIWDRQLCSELEVISLHLSVYHPPVFFRGQHLSWRRQSSSFEWGTVSLCLSTSPCLWSHHPLVPGIHGHGGSGLLFWSCQEISFSAGVNQELECLGLPGPFCFLEDLCMREHPEETREMERARIMAVHVAPDSEIPKAGTAPLQDIKARFPLSWFQLCFCHLQPQESASWNSSWDSGGQDMGRSIGELGKWMVGSGP